MDDLATAFEQLRPQLLRVAYGTLGSLAEAEDVVQDAWLRLERAAPEEIEDLRAWLTTVVARLSLDALKAARRKREEYVGQWLPEPIVERLGEGDPADRVTLDESVATALLVVLERLSPAERTAYLLHDMFGLAFVEACGMGDLDRLMEVLDPEVVFRSDGGGHVPASRFPLEGAERVARALLALERTRRRDGREMRGAPGAVNGQLGFVYFEGRHLNVLSFTIDAGRIVALDVVRNPEKLRHVRLPDR
ncbi:MAG TPA: sigma factor [Solirubrobacterales bacterium]|nr:sigma factor [Solirubrobacterales bacterium]